MLALKGRMKETSLFQLLVEECTEKGVTPPQVTWCRRTMKSKFSNIEVKKPKLDQSNTCERAYMISAEDNAHKNGLINYENSRWLIRNNPIHQRNEWIFWRPK